MSETENIKNMEFEEALQELESIVQILNAGKSTLKESVELYQRGTLLKKHCDCVLESAQLKINQISCNKDDVISIDPLSLEE